jgi:hypothetical protein
MPYTTSLPVSLQRAILGTACGVSLLACVRTERDRLPIVVSPGGHVTAVVDRWQPNCPALTSPFPVAWDSTLGDTAIILAAPLDLDSVASVFGVRRSVDGRLWHTFDGGDYSPDVATDSLVVGRWQVYSGEFEQQILPSDIDVPMEQGRVLNEHWRQSWFFGFAPASPRCAVVVAWRSLPVGSYRGPRFAESEIEPESLTVFFNRIRWVDSTSR